MRAHVAIPADIVAQVDEVVGPRRRSEFFAQAVREKLARVKRVTAAQAAAGSLAGVDTPGWETGESAAAWVHDLRRASDARLARPDDPT